MKVNADHPAEFIDKSGAHELRMKVVSTDYETGLMYICTGKHHDHHVGSESCTQVGNVIK